MKRSLADLSEDDMALTTGMLEAMGAAFGIPIPVSGGGRRARTVAEIERAERLIAELDECPLPDTGVML